mmetsp:Transcript_10614/g.20018  ORF Transcript_10614/g.20018 Transcript_10614/m.20018 type:complete len:236 (+) Transcript_10614:1157-1864(+)
MHESDMRLRTCILQNPFIRSHGDQKQRWNACLQVYAQTWLEAMTETHCLRGRNVREVQSQLFRTFCLVEFKLQSPKRTLSSYDCTLSVTLTHRQTHTEHQAIVQTQRKLMNGVMDLWPRGHVAKPQITSRPKTSHPRMPYVEEPSGLAPVHLRAGHVHRGPLQYTSVTPPVHLLAAPRQPRISNTPPLYAPPSSSGKDDFPHGASLRPHMLHLGHHPVTLASLLRGRRLDPRRLL